MAPYGKHRYPEHVKARTVLNQARLSGQIKKPKRCEKCGKRPWHPSWLQAHHEDYGKPLEVIWLCQSCHIKRHKELKTYVKSNFHPEAKSRWPKKVGNIQRHSTESPQAASGEGSGIERAGQPDCPQLPYLSQNDAREAWLEL